MDLFRIESMAGRTGARTAETGLDLTTCIVIATIATAAAIVAWSILALIRRDRRVGGPLLRDLAHGVGIGITDRRLIQDVAHRAGLRRAGAMLLSEGCFEYAIQRARPDGRTARRLQAIRARVFS